MRGPRTVFVTARPPQRLHTGRYVARLFFHAFSLDLGCLGGLFGRPAQVARTEASSDAATRPPSAQMQAHSNHAPFHGLLELRCSSSNATGLEKRTIPCYAAVRNTQVSRPFSTPAVRPDTASQLTYMAALACSSSVSGTSSSSSTLTWTPASQALRFVMSIIEASYPRAVCPVGIHTRSSARWDSLPSQKMRTKQRRITSNHSCVADAKNCGPRSSPKFPA